MMGLPSMTCCPLYRDSNLGILALPLAPLCTSSRKCGAGENKRKGGGRGESWYEFYCEGEGRKTWDFSPSFPSSLFTLHISANQENVGGEPREGRLERGTKAFAGGFWKKQGARGVSSKMIINGDSVQNRLFLLWTSPPPFFSLLPRGFFTTRI